MTSPTATPPTVSVIMPAYNAEAYVGAAVASILNQDWRDLELVVVEDGSTDGTCAILAEQASRDLRMRLLVQPENRGIVAALNLALSQARGPLIAVQHADDESEPERLDRQVRFLQVHQEVGVLATCVHVIDPAGQILDIDPYAGGLDNAALQAELLDHNPICHGTVMMRRSCLERVGHYDEALELTEDYDLWLRLAEITELAKLPDRLYQYRHHPESVSQVRRGAQMAAQGRTLEQAMRRRLGAGVTGHHLRSAAEAFRMAASIYLPQGDDESARRHLSTAMRLSPELFAEADTYVPLPAGKGSQQLDFLERALKDLPATDTYRRLGRLLRGRHYMRRGYAAARRGDWPRARRQLWRGVTADPGWLLNRGIWVLAGKALLRGWGPAGQANTTYDEGETI